MSDQNQAKHVPFSNESVGSKKKEDDDDEMYKGTFLRHPMVPFS
jgi:hypothetical protein